MSTTELALYTFIGLTIGYIVFYFATKRLFQILRCKSYYIDAQKLFLKSKNQEDKEAYTTLIWMYKDRLNEFEQMYPINWKISEKLIKV